MFEIPIEQCDVQDKKKLRLFRETVTKWTTWLSGDDTHAIWPQVYGLFWRDSVFRLVNQVRRLADEKPLQEVGFNGPVIGLFDAGFACIQAMTIRRLNEPTKQPPKGVISLGGLIKDVESKKDLITRENYVCGDGVPFDPQKASFLWRNNNPNKFGTIPKKGPEAWSASATSHKYFDSLSGVQAESRSRFDVLSDGVFQTLKCELAVCNDVEMHTHKFIAHAADPQNRHGLTAQQENLTLDLLNKCCRAIFLVADFITLLLNKTHCLSPIPTPQYNHLENLDKRWATSTRLRELHENWLERSREVKSWKSLFSS